MMYKAAKIHTLLYGFETFTDENIRTLEQIPTTFVTAYVTRIQWTNFVSNKEVLQLRADRINHL